MQRVHRTMARAGPRTADDSQVAILLKEFEDVDAMLDRLIAASRSWRDAWKQILQRQQRVAAEFDGFYGPIVGAGASSYSGPAPAETPDWMTNRTSKLSREYDELEADMKEELDEMDFRVIRPAEDAKTSIQPLKKVIKKRGDRKLDYEHHQHKFDKSTKKIGRSDKENRALTKHEGDASRTKEDYAEADRKLRESLPPILQGVYSLLPYILAAQITIQNNLLGHCYTQISQFCTEESFPVPAPPMEEVIQTWETDFMPSKEAFESVPLLRNGKAVHQSMKATSGLEPPPQPGGRRLSGQSSSMSQRSDVSPARSDASSRTQRSIAAPSPNLATKPSLSRVSSTASVPTSGETEPVRLQRMLSVPDQGPLAQSMPNYNNARTASGSKAGVDGLTPNALGGMSPAGPNADYFSRGRADSKPHGVDQSALKQFATRNSVVASKAASSLVANGGAANSSSLANAAAAAAKKRPPPPPKPKRLNSGLQANFVTALYDFTGQSSGDLTFREGDRIRVIKRTDSTQDWWEGELAGVQGSFPANYVQVA